MKTENLYRLGIPRWLYFALQNPETNWSLVAQAREVARKTLNIAQLKELALIIPPIGEQKQVVDRIDQAMDWLSTVFTESSAAGRLLDHLDQATLAKAFRGELVPQDPNDEPAAKLLERIRAARAVEPKPKRRRGKVAAD